jgi:hypothetical protein
MSLHRSVSQLHVEFVSSAEPTTEAEDRASYNTIQRALRKLLLDRGYDLAALASTSPEGSARVVVNPEYLGEVTQ